jgi:rod shape-determining protein MreD
MDDSILQRLDRWCQAALPPLVITLLILLTLAPIRISYVAAAAPLLPLMAVYHFSLFRPQFLQPLLLFVLGLFTDLLQGGAGSPLGISALIFVLVRALLDRNRRYLVDVSFVFIWLGYALLSAFAVALLWGANCLWSWRLLDPAPVIFQYVISLFFYPILGWVLGRTRARDPLNDAPVAPSRETRQRRR